MPAAADKSQSTEAWTALSLLMLAQMTCWVLSPVLTNDAPPLDVVENTVWGTERVIATYKNPGLSYALIEGARLLTGAYGWPAYVLSQIAVCTTYIFVFLLGRSELGPRPAIIGTLLLAACYYFGWHTPEFNQDIVEMPLWAGVCFTLWRAVETGKLGFWVALGVISAAAIYGKLSAGVLLIAAAVWLLTDAKARASFKSPGPWLAFVVFAVVMAPLTLWLVDGGFLAIQQYAVGRGREKFSTVQFIVMQAAVVVPLVLVLAWAAGLKRPALPATAGTADATVSRRFVIYLIWMTAGPILVAMAAVAMMRTGAKLMWGVPMLNLSGLILVAMAARTINENSVRRALIVALALTMSNSMSVAITTRVGNQFRSVPDRQNWPQREISDRFREIWKKETGLPLKIVAGEGQNWTSGLIALSPEGIPHVFTAADYGLAPWVTPDMVKKYGALVVWPSTRTVPKELSKLSGRREPRYETFALRHPGIVRDVTIGYVIVPPESGAADSSSVETR